MRFPMLAGACAGVCLATACALAPAAQAITQLTGGGPGTLSFIADGSSNTIFLGETARLSVCFDEVNYGGLASIADGSSNTILLGEGNALTLQAGRVLRRQPIANITDGSSNTIFLGESPPDALCFAGETRLLDPLPPGGIPDGSSNTIEFGEDSRFDVCFRNVRVGTTIGDGSSNTILIGELQSAPVCYAGVEVADDLRLAVAEPAALTMLCLGLIGAGALRRRG